MCRLLLVFLIFALILPVCVCVMEEYLLQWVEDSFSLVIKQTKENQEWLLKLVPSSIVTYLQMGRSFDRRKTGCWWPLWFRQKSKSIFVCYFSVCDDDKWRPSRSTHQKNIFCFVFSTDLLCFRDLTVRFSLENLSTPSSSISVQKKNVSWPPLRSITVWRHHVSLKPNLPNFT